MSAPDAVLYSVAERVFQTRASNAAIFADQFRGFDSQSIVREEGVRHHFSAKGVVHPFGSSHYDSFFSFRFCCLPHEFMPE